MPERMVSKVPKARLDKADIQAPVVSAYRLARCRHLLLRIDDAAAARAFLAALLRGGSIATVASSDPSTSASGSCGLLNIAFTYEGLCKLELSDRFLRVFVDRAPAFTEGAFPRAARRLADSGSSSADNWESTFKPPNAHILLTLHANSEHELAVKTTELEHLAGHGLSGWGDPHDGAHLPNSEDGRSFDPERPRRVHFGFIDGISKIAIDGLSRTGDPSRKQFAAGEFLLGEVNEAGVNAWVLPSAPAEVRSFFRCGTFAVLRKMEQEEAVFRDFVDRESERLGVERAYVKAKMLGRWQDGRVVTPTQAPAGSPPPADLDAFSFESDRSGQGCPLGSHIRRMNPRDDPVVPVGARPLIRRGMPYGPAYEADRTAERGLLGLFLCASLEDQFEHLVSEWGNRNPMGTSNRGTAKDPLFGNHGASGGVLDIPMADGSQRNLRNFKPFVTTRGTVYAFMPGLAALAVIARMAAPGGSPKGGGGSTGPATRDPRDCPICERPLSEHA